MLSERFENKSLMVHNHIHDMFEHPRLVNESYVGLRNLYDSFTKHLRALQSLGEKTESWDRLIIYILSNKFDQVTRREWENYKCEGELPKLQDINDFLKNKCSVLEKLDVKRIDKSIVQRANKGSHVFSATAENANFKCYYCAQGHSIFKCDAFLRLSVENRIEAVKGLKLCLNCLRHTHPSWKCKARNCNKCNKGHNNLLHIERASSTTSGANNNNPAVKVNAAGNESVKSVGREERETTILTHTRSNNVAELNKISQVLLSTALVEVKNGNNVIRCRALLDSGSQSNFISEALCKKLNLSPNKATHFVKGIGQALTNINKQVDIEIRALHGLFKRNINCLLLEKITDNLPVNSFNKTLLNIPSDVVLADPEFNISKEIDLLLGSEIFWLAINKGKRLLGRKLPVLQNTTCGWIIAGNMFVDTDYSNLSINCLSIAQRDTSLEEQVRKFWEIEEVEDKKPILSETEKYCEEYFKNSTKKDESGRYVVSIPFKESVVRLGNSRDIALKRFYSLENKLNNNQTLREEYKKFMKEYIDLGHMTEIDDNSETTKGYYLPHHAVIKATSLTTRLRVVFDASCKTTSGLSLNDVQYAEPTLQQDIFDILVRFRTYKYVMTGDISKMYRQILIDANDQNYQKIFWRANTEEEVKCYKLHTVTYGTASAPYLAVRCLFDIAEFEKEELISKIIKRDFYMDDLPTGANSEEEILYIQKNISRALKGAGFELRKWLCNDKKITDKFQLEKVEVSVLNLGGDEMNKTLGVFWTAQRDTINFKVNMEIIHREQNTRRAVLSAISQIYDPLGLIGTVVVVVKMIIQEMWKYTLGWDDELPDEILRSWNEFKNGIVLLNELKIPRQVVISQYITVELHGFSDASMKAYGACIYLRCILESGMICSKLLCAKSRVAPVKQVSLPRLELCAAQLLARLAKRIIGSVELKFERCYYWSDSTITLCWIRGESSKWKTFVANRVSEIQSLTGKNDWHYVRSEENPADLLSRGVTLNNLIESELWWYGPSYLNTESLLWNVPECSMLAEIPETKVMSAIVTNHLTLLERVSTDTSSFTEILHIVAYAKRFISNLRLKGCHEKGWTVALMPEELENSLTLLITDVQREVFTEEYKSLKAGKTISPRSRILMLNPKLNKNELLCVGGRLINSNQSEARRFPIILPNKHALTKYILKSEHERLLHCGTQVLLNTIRERYWPLTGRNECKKIIKGCLKCCKANPKGVTYLMGDLPEVRVRSYGVFENVGTDYGGPFLVKDKKGRGCKLIKGYICLFVCMCTKAVHIELVSELTTECFLAALSRFTSRRGCPRNIFSDNGLNYVGANNELGKIYEFLKENEEYLGTKLANERIKWHFTPANSPTFGGLWEAGIKSTKTHLKRVVGNRSLTFEEFNSLLVQVEGILNSRPLCPLSEDVEDCTALTPAHFLIGRTLSTLPEYNLVDVPENRLSKWQQMQALVQHYWTRWQKEYLAELQTRTRWRKNYEETLKIGSLVLVKDDNAPVLHWQLGRITKLHRGSDNVARVCTVKVRSGEIKRGVNRVCALPVDTDD